MKFSVKVGNGPVNKMIKFRLATVTVFRIDHYWEIGKVVNGHKSGAHTDSPDGGTGKTCFGGGMHCVSASSCLKLRFCAAASLALPNLLTRGN